MPSLGRADHQYDPAISRIYGRLTQLKLFDTHAHLTYPQLAEQVNDVITRATDADLVGMVSIATDIGSSYSCVDLARSNQNVFASVGIHPNSAHEANDDHWSEICTLATNDRVVAIGETGLDRYWDDCPIEIQREWFARHIDLSFELKKPLVVHMRECEADILEMFEQQKRDNRIIGIMHSFAGCWETAATTLELGMYISFAGMVTFKNAPELREIAAKIPDNRLLIETDSPYLTPHPHRSKRPNEPMMVKHTAQCLADVRGISLEELGQLTTENAKRVFNL